MTEDQGKKEDLMFISSLMGLKEGVVPTEERDCTARYVLTAMRLLPRL
jgi:hypothetical protein